MSTFEILGDDFLLDGRPHRILSGAIHYFRVPRAYWSDRIRKARQMGLNTIETYVAWNLHQSAPGTWEDSGDLDLAAFLDAIAAEGMHAVVRPGPYICAEFDGGGLPAWLLADPAVPVRTSNPRFLAPVSDYLHHVYDIVAPRQVDRGGPVILVQVENEYGAYGKDNDYLRELRDLTRRCGITVPLTTVDQPRGTMLQDGTLPDLLSTGSFGSHARERLATLRAVQPTGPLMCSEFWDGWFDQWGDYHHTTSPQEAAAELEELLDLGASVNLYMFHGGTNPALSNGANDKGVYAPITTSYDYDAPLDERGDPTPKYWAFREVLGRHTELPRDVPVPSSPAPSPTGGFQATVTLAEVLEHLGTQSSHDAPPTFDELAHYSGFLHLRCELDDPGTSTGHSTEPENSSAAQGTASPSCAPALLLEVGEVRDRAVVEADGIRIGVLERSNHDRTLALPADTRVLDLLVEDLGRVDYGPRIGEHKGVIGPVLVGGRPPRSWRALPLGLSDPAPVREALHARDPLQHLDLTAPTFLQAEVELEGPTDLFLDTLGWGHGLAWVNGRMVGRFSRRSPQRTLYVPAPLLRQGANELLVLEVDPVADASWAFLPAPELGPLDW